MKISELLNTKTPTLSFEVFPPKTDSAFETIKDAMVKGDKVTLTGFGVFEVRERAAKQCKNPRTGEMQDVPACKAPAFKAGKNLKEAVNK